MHGGGGCNRLVEARPRADIQSACRGALVADAFVAAGLSFIFALIAIALMMAWLRRASFTPFVVYRIALGVFLLVVAYGVI